MPFPALLGLAAGALGAYDIYRAGERKRDNQRIFDYFHAAIKHEEYSERAILRDKRGLLQSELRQAFAGKCSLDVVSHDVVPIESEARSGRAM